jgi:hypothetical protein
MGIGGGSTASFGVRHRHPSPDPCNPARRLARVRGFLHHLSALDGATEVPVAGLLGSTGHRKPPHVLTVGSLT